jgi:hypothetical protein
MLERVRKAATDWRIAQTALLGLITIVTVLKGPDSISSLPSAPRLLVGVLLFAALTLAAAGTYLVAEVAYGLPRPVRRLRIGSTAATPAEQAPDETRLALRGTGRLRIGLLLTFVALALMTAAIGVTWYAPQGSASTVKVQTATSTACGELVSGGSSMFLIDTKQGRQTITTAHIVSISPVST